MITQQKIKISGVGKVIKKEDKEYDKIRERELHYANKMLKDYKNKCE